LTGGARPSGATATADGSLALLRSFSEALRPPPVLTTSQWAEAERIVSPESGSPWPGPWSNDRVPFAREMMDVCGLDHPCRKVTIKGSAQVVKSEAGLNAIGHAICTHASPILVLLPSLDEAQKYNRVKLQPMIDATPSLRSRVLEMVSRDELGSTTSFKRFRGGYLLIANAGSPKALQMISARLRIYEEVSGYPPDVGGRGDPTSQADARSKAWQPRGDKVVYISTPGVAGACRITEEYEASDQRRLYVPCPCCGCYQRLTFERLRHTSDRPPHGAYFACAANVCVIEPEAKAWMLARHAWIKTYPDDEHPPPGEWFPAGELERWRARSAGGREPGFALWQAYSPFVEWDDTVAEHKAVSGDPIRLKAFWQQALGEAWEEQGEVPEWRRLAERAGPYQRGTVPLLAVVLVAAVDVQRDRLECDVWAFGPRRQRFMVEHVAIDKKPEQAEAWAELDEVLLRRFPHEGGTELRIEKLAIDTGDGVYTQDVYRWVRSHAGDRVAMAIKGVRTYNRASPISGPTYVDVDVGGKKIRRGVRLWTIAGNTYKSALYKLFQLDAPTAEERAEGRDLPVGYVHFPAGLPDEWFKQLTAERHDIRRDKRTGRMHHDWVQIRERNEALDNAVYVEAPAYVLGLERWDDARWAQERARRGLGEPPKRAARNAARPPEAVPAPAVIAADPSAPARGGWAGRPGGGWLGRR
jgi:phage terminase large subunit GpA-like protein